MLETSIHRIGCFGPCVLVHGFVTRRISKILSRPWSSTAKKLHSIRMSLITRYWRYGSWGGQLIEIVTNPKKETRHTGSKEKGTKRKPCYSSVLSKIWDGEATCGCGSSNVSVLKSCSLTCPIQKWIKHGSVIKTKRWMCIIIRCVQKHTMGARQGWAD